MNANELADKLEDATTDPFQVVPWFKALNQQAATMLRQQQLKIDNLLENNARLDAEIDVLKSHPANACKHEVDDGACKECYLEATHPAELTDEEIFSIAIDCTYGGDLHADKFARAILRKASEK